MFSTIALLFLMPLASGYFYDGSGCTDWALRYNLPCSIKSANITAYTVSDAAPFVSRVGNGVPCGLNIDLMNYIGYIYRINFQYKFVNFADLAPAVQADPNAIAISPQAVTQERVQKTNFAQYLTVASQYIVRSNYQGTITGLASLCGKTVVAETGSVQLIAVNGQKDKCAGNSPIKVVEVPNLTELLESLRNGTAQVGLEDAPTLAYAAAQSDGEFKVVGQSFNSAPYGIACNKDNRDLCCGFVNAINYLIQEGIYQQLLEKYSFPFKTFGVCPSKLNLQGSTCEPKCALSTAECKALQNA